MPAGQGAVVLDIGGDVGALVVHVPDQLAGAEIEICPAGRRSQSPDEGAGWWAGAWRGVHEHAHEPGTGHDHDQENGHDHDHGPAWPHVAVLLRPGGRAAAVFPALHDGRYELWLRPDGPTAVVADVRGGEVSTREWPVGR